ncbi:MAG TPA: tetratricopeptide repeat protein [Thermoanaerobaculia bacterium]|nr:tetratricopeptide repeat protein [Thermoanaerobaculia bacterium]
MIRNYRTLVVALLLSLLAAGSVWAIGEGRFTGTVMDQEGKPVAGAKITVTSPGSSYKQEKTTNDKGKFTIMVVDAMRKYEIRIEKEGYSPIQGPLAINPSAPTDQDFTLAVAGPSAEELAEIKGKNDAVAAFNEGVALVKAKDFPGAAGKFEQALTLDPTITQGHQVLADVYFEMKKYPEAIASADKYLATSPASTNGMYVLKYDSYLAMGDKAKASAALQEMLQKEPGKDAAVRIFNLGAEAQRKDDDANAEKYLRQAIELDPTLERAYASLGTYYLRQKKYDASLDMADRLLKQNANSAEALSLRYESLKALKRTDEAKQAMAAMQASAGNQTAEEAFRQGVALYNANNVAEAEKAFERALAKDGNYAKAHYLLGLVEASKGNMAKAREYVQTFLKLAPNDPQAAEAKAVLAELK